MTFEQCLPVLSEWARIFYVNERAIDLPAERRTLRSIAKQLDKAVVDLETLEATKPDRAWSTILVGTREQAISARRAAEKIPDGRVAITLRRVVETFVILRSLFGLSKPVLSNTSEDVKQVTAICKAADLHLSPERIRGALADACHLVDGGRVKREDGSVAALIRMMAAAKRWPSGVAAAELVAEGLWEPEARRKG